MLDKSPVLGPGRGPPSCNRYITVYLSIHLLKDVGLFPFGGYYEYSCYKYLCPGSCVNLKFQFSRISTQAYRLQITEVYDNDLFNFIGN